MDLVFIHGPPAAGKYTVGKALAALTGYPLFHNHLVVDAVGAVFPFGSPAFVSLRQQFWLAVFEAAAREARPLIFTFAPEPTVPADFPARAAACVEAHSGRTRYVRLTIEAAEQERRLVAEDRGRFNKLRSVEILRQLRAAGGAEPPAELTIDTGLHRPEAAARRILEALRLEPLAPAAPSGDA